MSTLQKVLYTLLIVAIAIALFCGIVFIASQINGITFGEQFIEWFAKKATEPDAVEEIVDTTAKLIA